jgi:6,7-dimethyl-8-ribityllumazine synthase
MITDTLLEGALAVFHEKLKPEQIEIIKVPGAYEIPVTIQRALEWKKFHGVLALGAVIKGDTAHFEYVCDFVNQGIGEVSLKTNTPVAMGVLTTYDLPQAMERIGGIHGHKGKETAQALLEMVDLWQNYFKS